MVQIIFSSADAIIVIVSSSSSSMIPTCSGASVALEDTPMGITSSSEMAAVFATTTASWVTKMNSCLGHERVGSNVEEETALP